MRIKTDSVASPITRRNSLSGKKRGGFQHEETLYVPTKSGRVGRSDSVRGRVRPGPGLVEVAEDGGRQQGRRLDQVGAAAALHPHRDPRHGALLFRLAAAVIVVVLVVLLVLTLLRRVG